MIFSTSSVSASGNETKGRQLKYQQVETELRQLAKTLPIGAKLPAERDLAVTFGCNFLTVRKAMKLMVRDGTIVRRVGSGTFIGRNPETATNYGEAKIGVLVFQGSNDYAYRVLQSISHAGLEQKVDLRSGWIRNFSDEALFQANSFKNDGCVALTLPWFPPELTTEVREFVKKCPIPVSLGALIPGLEANCFEMESVFGSNTEIEDLCLYFHSLGHERIALLGPDLPSDQLLQKKITTFIRYASRENLPSPCSLVPPGTAAMDQLAERWREYRGGLAVISYDDEHALRFMTAMHKIGCTAPNDYCIIGFNDTEGSRFSDPPLSTIHQNFDYISSWLLKNALALAKGTSSQSTTIPKLKMLVRSTCGGRGRIDDTFRSKFQTVELVVEPDGLSQARQPSDEPVLENV